MKITLKAELKILRQRDFQRVMEKFLDLELSGAVQAFLIACLDRIPVQTGFARGSFGDVARFFKVRATFYGSNPRNLKYQGIIKSPESGRKFVTRPELVIKRTGDLSASINLENLIKYFLENDTGSKISSAPWGSIQAGADAANNYLETVVSRIPKLESILSTLVIAVNGENSSKSVRDSNAEVLLTQMKLLEK